MLRFFRRSSAAVPALKAITHSQFSMARFNSTQLEKTLAPSVSKWVGKVSGTPEDIKRALEALDREPKDIEELAKLIREQRQESLSKDFEEAHKGCSPMSY